MTGFVQEVYAFYIQDGEAVIKNNVAVTRGGWRTWGMHVGGPSAGPPTYPVIANNTLNGGGGTQWATALILVGETNPTVVNNILWTESAATDRCIHELDATADPTTLRNNAFADCDFALYGDDGASRTLEAQLNDSTLTTQGLASQAIANRVYASIADLMFAGAEDYQPTLNSPNCIHVGGLDASQDVCGGGGDTCGNVTDDRDSNPRTALYSVGAYESEISVTCP